MRAVVTGGAGFIGSHLVDRLCGLGWDVHVVDRATGPSIQEHPGAPVADAIFHLASPVGPVGVLEWAGKLAVEVIETTRIVRYWALLNDCPLVDVSTSEVYGSGARDREADDCTFRAESSARKEYAVAKLAGETMLLNTPTLRLRIVRPFNVAGPRQRPDGGFVLPRFVGQALAGEPLTVYGNGSARRAFTHVADVVDGLVLALTAGSPGQVYNLGNPANATSILELAREVIAAVGHGRIIHVNPVALHGPGFREAPDKLPDPRKAVGELGWRPRFDRTRIIGDVVEYWTAELAAA